MRRRTRLSNEQVAQVRRDYEWARHLALTARTAEEWETVGETEARLARTHSISATTVHEIVLGLRYQDAPGPIDSARRARHDTYLAERELLGPAVARARMMEVDVPVAAMVAVTVHTPGQEPVTTWHPAGTRVEVTAGTPSPAQDSEDGHHDSEDGQAAHQDNHQDSEGD